MLANQTEPQRLWTTKAQKVLLRVPSSPFWGYSWVTCDILLHIWVMEKNKQMQKRLKPEPGLHQSGLRAKEPVKKEFPLSGGGLQCSLKTMNSCWQTETSTSQNSLLF